MKKLLLMGCIFSVLMAEGKIGGITFLDYTYSDDESAFNFNRQYFSYGIDVSENVKFKFVLDVGTIYHFLNFYRLEYEAHNILYWEHFELKHY